MSVFADKKFETLDWMTQMTETIESELNTVLAQMPEETILDREMIYRILGDSWYMHLSISNVVRHILTNTALANKLSWDERSKLDTCFEFDMDDNVVLDETTGTLSGTIRLIKVISTFEDDVLQKCMGSKGLEKFNFSRWDTSGGTVGRANEIMELLGGCELGMKNRSIRKKMYTIRGRLTTIFKNNEWRIRDAELADKVCTWIIDYIRNGNLAGLTNFCKLKVMTHSNMPIYSVQEEIL